MRIRINKLILQAKLENLKTWLTRPYYNVLADGIPTIDLVNTIFGFCEMYCGVKFYPYQEQFAKRIIRSVLENDGLELTALFARQMGKLVY